MEYTDLKNGNIVVMTNEYVENRIIIVDRVEQSITGVHKLYTYAELDVEYDDLFLEKYEPGWAYDVKYCSFRPAEEEEKIKLYNALGKEFTEEYDFEWYKHFTDSSYYDIQDYLFDVFCINVEEYDDDYIYPAFINDIQDYIWHKCCEAVGMPDGFNEEPEEEMVSLEQVKKWLKDNMYECDSDEKWVNTYFHTMEEMFNDLEKTIGE
jgi:hypothetical protein